MSALSAPLTGRRDEVKSTHRQLHAVTEPAPRLARFPFLLVLIGIFGIGMAGLLMVNTTLQSQAFQSRTLNRQATELAYAQADLENQLDALEAPQELARRASELGMRPNPYPGFLQLPSGKVVAKPRPVQGGEVPSLIVKTPAQIAAEHAAKRARAEAKAAAREAKRAAAAAEAKRKAAERAAAHETKADKKKADKKNAERPAETTAETTAKKGSDHGGRR